MHLFTLGDKGDPEIVLGLTQIASRDNVVSKPSSPVLTESKANKNEDLKNLDNLIEQEIIEDLPLSKRQGYCIDKNLLSSHAFLPPIKRKLYCFFFISMTPWISKTMLILRQLNRILIFFSYLLNLAIFFDFQILWTINTRK